MSTLTLDAGNGYTRIRLESPSRLVVNAWLLQNDGKAVLFDTGFTHTTDQLIAGLEAANTSLDDLDAVVYTHTHNDHLGGGVALDDKLQCPNILWEGTHPQLYTDFYAVNESIPSTAEWLESMLPRNPKNQERVQEMASIPEGRLRSGGTGALSRKKFVAIGDEIDLAGRRFRCIDARGHDLFHVAWLDLDTSTLISGDVILRVPTPLMPHMSDDLPMWLDTLQRWEDTLDVQRMLPGHGMASALFKQSIQRSRLVVQRLYEAAQRCLEDGLPVDPVDIIEEYSGTDRSRYAQRFAVATSTLLNLLSELQMLGFVRPVDGGYWLEVRALPPWDALQPWPKRTEA